MMAALLVLAFVFATPASLYAQSNGKMKDEGAMMEKSENLIFKGLISNVQLDSSGKPDWIQSGFWVLRMHGDSASLVARMTMVKPDGSSLHTHAITNLSVTEHSTEGSTHTIEGTATVAMSAGAVQNVPIVIMVMNNAVVAIRIGPEGLDGHFGSNPIYGTVFQSKAIKKGGAMMEEKPAKLTKTNIPVTIPLTRGFVDGNEVFYFSTEASDRDLAGHLTNITGARVSYAPALANTPASALASIYAFSNGIEGEGPLGFQPNVADSQPGDPEYSPLWRIIATTWQDAGQAKFFTTAREISLAISSGMVMTEVAGVAVNCPFVEVN